MQDLASVPLTVSLECRRLADRQEPHKANFCLEFSPRSKWEPAELSVFPHTAVPCCLSPEVSPHQRVQDQGTVASMFASKAPSVSHLLLVEVRTVPGGLLPLIS